MDWTLAIVRNRDALLRIVAGLYVLAGLTGGRIADVLPRAIYHAILRVLRPAESAVRRLIVIAARGLDLGPRAARAGLVGHVPKASADKGSGNGRIPSFCLIDPLKRFGPFDGSAEDVSFWVEGPDVEDDDDTSENMPSIRALPRVSVPGFFDPVFAPPPVPLPDGMISAARLLRRLAALKRALDTLPQQARRLARWQARQNLMLRARHSSRPDDPKLMRLKPLRLTPIRPGLPPGHRDRQTHEIDAVLRECHGLGLDLQRLVDTS
jgi:hypothetical protein